MIFGKHINRYYLRYFHILLLGTVALLLVDYFQLKIPELYRIVVNALNGNVENFDLDFLLDEICLPMLFIILMLVVGRFLWRICFFGSDIRMATDLRRRMFDRCKDLSQSFYKMNKVGDLMSYYTNDLETIEDCFGSGIMMFVDALFLGGLAVVKMAKMNPVLTLLSLIPMVFMFVAGVTVGKSLSKKWDERQACFSKLSDFAQESFSGISVIKAFVKEGFELLSFKKINAENERVNVQYTKYSTLLNISVDLFVESVICVILGYGGYLVHEGIFDAGQMIEFLGYFTSVIWPIIAISELIDMRSRGKASLLRVGKLLDEDTTIKDRPGARELSDAEGEIEFRNLSFAYPDDNVPVLKNLSFRIKAGETVGITGRTGSGKSTIADLILRTYEIDDGTLFLDGHDVNDLTVESVRRQVAYVPQDNFLFSDTIARNIGFASGEAPRDRVIESATLSAVNDDIRGFPHEYDTVLGERGVTVSGGQKQRISIARALLKDAPVLILDDSLSAVDTDTEKTLLENLAKTRKGKTTILLSHRISTIVGSDLIVYLDNGQVVASGTHEELLRICPQYAETVRLQKLEEDDQNA